MDLNDYLWKKRLLLIFSPSESCSDYKIQMEELNKRKAETEDRDLQILEIFDEEVNHLDSISISHEQGKSLKKRFGVKTGQFTVILLGKDGGEKYRSKKYIPIEDIFAIIDAMPMRQAEMKERQK